MTVTENIAKLRARIVSSTELSDMAKRLLIHLLNCSVNLTDEVRIFPTGNHAEEITKQVSWVMSDSSQTRLGQVMRDLGFDAYFDSGSYSGGRYMPSVYTVWIAIPDMEDSEEPVRILPFDVLFLSRIPLET